MTATAGRPSSMALVFLVSASITTGRSPSSGRSCTTMPASAMLVMHDELAAQGETGTGSRPMLDPSDCAGASAVGGLVALPSRCGSLVGELMDHPAGR